MEEKEVVEVKENPQDLPEEGKKKWWNKKRAIKVISISLVAVILLSVGIAYFAPKIHWYYLDQKYFDGKEPAYKDRILVGLNREYTKKYANGELTVQDFKLENIEKISGEGIPYPYGESNVVLHLKETGSKQVKEAILHCRKLEFVVGATFMPGQWL